MAEAPAQEQAPQAADVTQSTVSTEADDIQQALAVVEAAEGGGAEKPAPEEKAEAKGEKTEPEKKADEDDEKPPKGGPASVWASVRKKEQRLQKLQKDLENRDREFATTRQSIEDRLKQIEAREAELDQDPVKFLSKKGLTFDDLARRFLNDGKATPEEAARRMAQQQSETAKAYEERIAKLEAKIEERDVGRAVSIYRSDIKGALDAPELELLRSYDGAEDEVFEYAAKHAQKTGQALTPRDAALRIQAELQKRLEKLGSHQVVRNLLLNANGSGVQQRQAVSGQGQVPRGNGSPSGPKTLTNNLAATPPATEPDLDSLSEDELIKTVLRSVLDA